ncbi:DUF4189 domain-containing protein [Nocardia seriolae]|uniref:DUF4189 domain-containing protein n=1 Tax=Nocardia seriolae TaxID=37332 RepID=UPI001194B011|nr:DUF4189 domain-containing protein [Nocardia seriolae]GEM27028.1 hypothetical protein NS2_52670 [Nocardia seriolae NBRC 15557]
MAVSIVRSVAAVVFVAACAAVGSGPALAEPGPDGHMYGAFAVSNPPVGEVFDVGSSWNYPDQAGADARALSECGKDSCTVALRYMDGCGAIAFRGGRYAGGIGPTGDDASRSSLNAVGPPFPSSISADAVDPSEVVGPQCNGRA